MVPYKRILMHMYSEWTSHKFTISLRNYNFHDTVLFFILLQGPLLHPCHIQSDIFRFFLIFATGRETALMHNLFLNKQVVPFRLISSFISQCFLLFCISLNLNFDTFLKNVISFTSLSEVLYCLQNFYPSLFCTHSMHPYTCLKTEVSVLEPI